MRGMEDFIDADAASLIRRIRRHRLPDALRRADTLARHGLPQPPDAEQALPITALIAATCA